MKKTNSIKLKIGEDIILDKGERILTFKNKINGLIYYSTTKYKPVALGGGKGLFMPVFEKPASPNQRRISYISMDAIERLYV